MATGEPLEKAVLFPDWAMLDRYGRTYSHVDLDSAREAAIKKKTAVEFDTVTGHRCFLSFSLSDRPEGISYLDLHWPLEGSAEAGSRPAYPYVRATDEDLVLFHISIPSQPNFHKLPSDLFVYAAAGPSPSVQRLPLYTEPRKRPFLWSTSTTGILRLEDDRYIVSDLNVYAEEKEGPDNYSMLAELCVFDSKSEKWQPFLEMPAPQPQDQSPILWSIDEVLSFGRQFLYWVDYLSGILVCDFSNLKIPVLHFAPLPAGEEYSKMVRTDKCLSRSFRRMSVSQDMMHFVHINGWYPPLLRTQEQQLPPQEITIWTSNMMAGNPKFEWKVHHVINLDYLWKQPGCQPPDMCLRLPEFPVVCAKDKKDQGALFCMLRNKEFYGQKWMIMVDMKPPFLWSCTKYINQRPYTHICRNEKDVEIHQNLFSLEPLLPTVFSKYLVRPTEIPRDNNKVATNPSKRVKLETNPPGRVSLQCEDKDLESGDSSC